MTDQIDDFNGDQSASGEDSQRNFRRDLEDRAKNAELERDELKRKLAFASVKGLDLSNPQHKFFAENYKGELSSDAVTATAKELGFLNDDSQHQQQTSTTPNPDAAAQARLDAASQGAEAVPVTGSQEADLQELTRIGATGSMAEYIAKATQMGMVNNSYDPR